MFSNYETVNADDIVEKRKNDITSPTEPSTQKTEKTPQKNAQNIAQVKVP